MEVNFIARGRLGNAIFRYFACAISCILYNGKYNVKYYSNTSRYYDLSEEDFKLLQTGLLNEQIKNTNIINLNCFYQYDIIYRKFKDKIINFIKNNQEHFIETDGINAGDGRNERFYMLEIIEMPIFFNKKYNNVLHIRLEDFVTHNLYIKTEQIIELFDKNIIENTLCIVCKTPNTEFEINYINIIKTYLENKNITVIQESNDTLTDYYIMKCAETLICSKSTLSWCAALLSTTIKTCYIPKNESFKYPIDNTYFY
jgi:hypothetical protein